MEFVSTAIQYEVIVENEPLVRIYAGNTAEFGVNGRWLQHPNRRITIRPSGAMVYLNENRRLVIEMDPSQILVANVHPIGARIAMTMVISADTLTLNSNVRMNHSHTIVRDGAPKFHDAPAITINVRNIRPIHAIDVSFRENTRFFVYDARRDGVNFTQFSLRRMLDEMASAQNVNMPIVNEPMIIEPTANALMGTAPVAGEIDSTESVPIAMAPTANAPIANPPNANESNVNNSIARSIANEMIANVMANPIASTSAESQPRANNNANAVASNNEIGGARTSIGLPAGLNIVPPPIEMLPMPTFSFASNVPGEPNGSDDERQLQIDENDAVSESVVETTPAPPFIDLTKK